MYTKDYGFAVLNGVGKSSGSFLCKVDAYTLETQSIVKISNKPVTAFCLRWVLSNALHRCSLMIGLFHTVEKAALS